MLEHALAEQPNECCGLLAGVVQGGGDPEVPGPPVGQVVEGYPLANALASPRAYHAEDRCLFEAHKDMRRRGLDFLAVYHSHPTSAPVPSAADHREWYHGPGVVSLILSLTTSPPTIRGWWLTDAGHHEASWEVTG